MDDLYVKEEIKSKMCFLKGSGTARSNLLRNNQMVPTGGASIGHQQLVYVYKMVLDFGETATSDVS